MPLPLPLIAATAAAVVPLAATAAVSLGLAASLAVARPGNSPTATGRRRQSVAAIDELAQLRRELALDVRQETIWNKAESSCWETIGAERRRLDAQYAAMLELLRQPDVDLRALLGPLDAFQSERRRLGEDRVDQWAAVYDALDAAQQEKARAFLRRRIEQALAGDR